MAVTWEYSEADFIYITDWGVRTLSKFDKALQECWHSKQNDNVFRYKLNVQKSKFLGKHRLFIQLNTERGSLYRQPQKFVSVDEPFNPNAFNFTKMKEAEKMFELKRKDLKGCEATLAVNVSPIESGHSLILPSLYSCLPQVMTEESLQVSVDVLLLSASPALRVIYNSPCAFASINHLHFHALYLDQRMTLETAPTRHLSGPCFELVDFPSKGFMFEMGEGSSQALCSNVFKLVSFFQKNNIAHNLCLTRGTSQVSSAVTNEARDCVRAYVWGRTACNSTVDSKTIFEILPAACELFGFITAKTEAVYEKVSAEDVEKILHDVTNDVYQSVRNGVKLLFDDTHDSSLASSSSSLK
ncbi:unnamed protein product [Bemisia tabaci]|uniref:GDP-D-glucose phosphorylase 1 n=1 Tax=Bemisia tabaci TaxID=7038 RepID=A0A9P0G4L5_BEMTA|nr:unnamed protein product [Bemisia tabaci]